MKSAPSTTDISDPAPGAPRIHVPLHQLVRYFLLLGTLGFGGPVALCGQMERELVAEKGWLTKAEMRDAIAVSQSMPGPLAIQVGIFAAYMRGGFKGAWAGGWAFILPNFLIVASLGALYAHFACSEVGVLFYLPTGVRPAAHREDLMMKLRAAHLGLAVALLLTLPARAAPDWAAVGKALGKVGTMQAGGIYKVSLPRSNLKVTLDGVPLKAGFALGSWVAFEPMGDEAIVMGDLVLTHAEVNPVMTRLEEAGFAVTALLHRLQTRRTSCSQGANTAAPSRRDDIRSESYSRATVAVLTSGAGSGSSSETCMKRPTRGVLM